MDERMTRDDLLDLIHTHYAEWETLLAQIPRERMTERGVVGEWTVDIIAHVTWSEREMLPVLRERVFQGSPLWNLPTDERNQAIFEENRGRSLDDVLAEHRQVHAALVQEIERLTDEELHDGTRFVDMPPAWNMALILPANTYKHYTEHVEDIERWLRE